MAEISGAEIIAKSLKTQGVPAMYGVVGIPVTGIASAAQREGIRYIGTRHEMPATYAAQRSVSVHGAAMPPTRVITATTRVSKISARQ